MANISEPMISLLILNVKIQCKMDSKTRLKSIKQ